MLEIPTRSNKGSPNWAAAFMLYARGLAVEEVASTMRLPIERVRTKARDEDWHFIARDMPVTSLLAPVETHDETTLIDAKAVAEEVRGRAKTRQQMLHSTIFELRKKLDEDIEETIITKAGPVTTTRPLTPMEYGKVLRDLAAATKSAREEDAFAHRVPLTTDSPSNDDGKNKHAQVVINMPSIMGDPTKSATEVTAVDCPKPDKPKPKKLDSKTPKAKKLTEDEIFGSMGLPANDPHGESVSIFDADVSPQAPSTPLSEAEKTDWRTRRK